MSLMFLEASDARATVVLWFYRAGHFFVTSVLDDPAWLALMFC